MKYLCAFRFCFLLVALFASLARAQTPGATLVTSLLATQGETITYTAVITNRAASALTNVAFSDVLDPNTTLVPGSINTSPLAFADSFAAVGNIQITIAAPGVLANDVDIDGVGPALAVTAATTTSANGGNVTINANGSFTYNPPRGFEGVDTFTYQLNDGEGFSDIGTVSMTVTGMIWFVNSAAPAGGDGRLSNPFNTLAAFAAINNGVGTNPAAGDNVFLYSGTYTGPVTLLNTQKLIGQGASASISSITGLTPPAGSLALPATGGARPVITGSGGGVALASGNLVRGINFTNSGGTALGGASVGALTVTEAAVTNSAGVAVSLTNGTLNVALGSVAAAGGANGLRLVNCTGSFTVSGDGALAQNGTGGTIQNTTGNGVHLDNVTGVSLARMNINNSAANGVFGQNLNGLIIDWCSLINNGDAVDESGIRIGDPVAAVNGLIGTAPAGANPTRIANTLIRASGEMNVAIFNNGATLTQLDVTNVISKDTRTRPLGADGFYFETRGNAVATVNFSSCSFSNNFTQGIQALALAQSALTVNVTNSGFTNNNEGIVLENANDADIIFDVNGNRFFNNLATGASGAAITVVNATTVTPSAIYSGKVRNNTVSGGGIDNHLIAALLAGAGNNTLNVASNNVNAVNAQFSGIFIQAGETGSGNLNANVTVTSNTVSVGALGSHGIVVQSRITSTLCAEIAGNVSTTAGAGLFGINVRQRDTSTFRLPGFAGPFNSTAAVITFLQGKNPGSTIGATVATAYSGGAACVLPLLAMPRTLLHADESDGRAGLSSGRRTTHEDGGTAVGNQSRRAEDSAALPSKVGIQPSGDLNPFLLKPIVAAARQRWSDAGLTREQLAVIDSLRFEVTDLAGWYLGASSDRVVKLDRRASGYGWFIDPTPADDRSFGEAVTATRLSSAAQSGRIDLLSAVLHEMGHNLGLADDYTPAARDSVMYGFLIPDERRVPFCDQAREAVPNNGAGTHYLFTPINIGTLPAGKSITITFQVVVTNPMPAGVCVLTNQGTVTANGGISVLTDDPRTVPLADATLTTVLVAPLAITQPASGISGNSATLNGVVNPCGTNAGYYFQYGLTLSYGSNTPTGSLPAGSVAVPVNAAVSSLQAGATYHFRLVATNRFGTNVGVDLTFTTPLTILQQPTNTIACVSNTATFSVTASSTNVLYQWQRRLPGAGVFQDIGNATNAAYTTPPAGVADDGTSFRVIVSSLATNLTSAEALLSVISISNATVTYNFNSGLPTNTAIYGSAFFSNGVLELNVNTQSQSGAFLTTDLAPGRVVRGFAVTFKARSQLGAGSFAYADGFSFTWAADLPNGIYAVAEEGQGSGLSVCFDTYDNGLGEAPAIDVKWGTNVIGHYATDNSVLPGAIGDFADVAIRLNTDGTLDMTYRCRPIFARLPIPGYAPLINSRFGLGSRTGGANESHSIEDLSLQLFLDPTNGVPRLLSISNQPPLAVALFGAGSGNVILEASTNLLNWSFRASVAVNSNGLFQYTDNTAGVPYRFYRLKAAAQFPTNLIAWWRAEGNYLDSFGGNNGVSGFEPAPAFAPGQRGQAFSFNGTNQSMFIGGAPVPVPWTACFWVKRQDATNGSAALLADSATGLKLEQFFNTRRVGFTQFGVADYYFNTIVPTNVWTHLTFVGVPGGTILYTNGIAAETNAVTISLPRGVLGGLQGPGGDHLQGLLDETTLFNRALSPAEIQQVINATRGP